MAFSVRFRFGLRYLGDRRAEALRVHDLACEDTTPGRCDVQQIVDAGDAVGFAPDSLAAAEREGYLRCPHCTPIAAEVAEGRARRTEGPFGRSHAAGP